MKRISLLLALVLVIAACGDDTASTTTSADTTTPPATTPPPTTAPPTTVPPTTLPPTTLPPTTTTAPTTTTTAAPATTVAGSPFTTAAYGFFPDPLGTAEDGHGSGCVIAGNVLTDGMWFGYVDALAGGEVTFDLACFYTGTVAQNAAAADGEEAFDFYIRNQNPLTFAVPLDSTGTAYWLDGTGDLTPLAIAMTAWPMSFPPSYQVCPDDRCSVWLYVNGGIVTELIEQYLP